MSENSELKKVLGPLMLWGLGVGYVNLWHVFRLESRLA